MTNSIWGRMPAIVSRISGAPARSRSARVLAPVSTPATIAAPAFAHFEPLLSSLLRSQGYGKAR